MIDRCLLEALEYALTVYGASQTGKVQYGWHDKSIGCSVEIDSKESWMRIHRNSDEKSLEQDLLRTFHANGLSGIRKPDVSLWEILKFKGESYGILLMTLISEPTISNTAHLDREVDLQSSWTLGLWKQLESLSTIQTDYVSCTQALITRRIQERFGDYPHVIKKWSTIHGDLNWSNITEKTPFILDWEGWGSGPSFMDIYFLYAFSLSQPITSGKIRETFKDIFESQHAKTCLLFICSELMRMVELHNDHPDLYPFLDQLAQEIKPTKLGRQKTPNL